MIDIEKMKAVYDKRLKKLKDLRRRQEEEKEFITGKTFDYVCKVEERASSDSVDIDKAVLKKHPKGDDILWELFDEIQEVSSLAIEIITKRYDNLEY